MRSRSKHCPARNQFVIAVWMRRYEICRCANCCIFASPHEPGAAAILPQSVAATAGFDIAAVAIAVIRLEGIALSVEDRACIYDVWDGPTGAVLLTHCHKRPAKLLVRSAMLICLQIPWRHMELSCTSIATAIVAAIEPFFETTFYADWAAAIVVCWAIRGGIWPRSAGCVDQPGGGMPRLCDRSMSKSSAGFSTCREQASLTKRVKAADPLGVLNFGRMHNGLGHDRMQTICRSPVCRPTYP